MMTELLNDLSPGGAYSSYVYWLGVLSMCGGFIAAALFGLRIILVSISVRIIEVEIDRLAAILVPKYFNRTDFVDWLNTPNATFNGNPPWTLVMVGKGHALYQVVQHDIDNLSTVELYEGILHVAPTKEKQTVE